MHVPVERDGRRSRLGEGVIMRKFIDEPEMTKEQWRHYVDAAKARRYPHKGYSAKKERARIAKQALFEYCFTQIIVPLMKENNRQR